MTGVAEKTYIEAIRDGIREEMQRDERVMILGEDVGAKGGVFGVTEGLQKEFGEARVLDSPLAESLIVGVRHRRGDERAATDRRDPVPGLHHARGRSDRQRSREDALPEQRRLGRADGAALTVRRGSARRALSLAVDRGDLRAHPRAARGRAVDAVRRQGHDHRSAARPGPGAVLRAQALLPRDQGRGARMASTPCRSIARASCARARTSRSSATG